MIPAAAACGDEPTGRRGERGRGQQGADTRQRLILAAEKLVGEQGPGVSLRQIGLAAGQRNPSAIQYHFGTKEELLHGVFRYRLPWINGRRLELLAEVERDTLADLVRINMWPHVEMVQQPDNHYVQFAARMFLDAQFAIILKRVEEPELIDGQLQIHRRLRAHLRHLPKPVFLHRLRFSMTHLLYALAEQRRVREQMGPQWAEELDGFVADYIDYAAAGLAAPVALQT